MISDLATPQVLVERRRVTANIARMQQMTAHRGIRLRPHAKTHKLPAVAAEQLAAGAVGICCAKVGEAEVFADAGITDIRLPYPVPAFNANRVLALLKKGIRLSIVVDHPAVADAWSRAMVRAAEQLDVLVKVDVGFHRCGVDPLSAGALALVRQVAGLPGVRFRGLLSHAGHAYHATSDDELERIAREEVRLLAGVAEAARAHGVKVEEVSVGATPTARFSARLAGITEMRPGNYVYFDRSQVALAAAAPSDCALTVLTTVVSKPAPDRLVLDAGSKTLSSDAARGFAPLPGHGSVLTSFGSDRVDDTLLVERLSEEHAVVRVLTGETRLEPGDRVRVLPNHACVVANLVDEVHFVDGPNLVETLRVAARGRIS
jgi:D-serine deaminase-like pyridoxal phosphate-dependent protein